jgi:hypothetical protein
MAFARGDFCFESLGSVPVDSVLHRKYFLCCDEAVAMTSAKGPLAAALIAITAVEWEPREWNESLADNEKSS